MGKEASFEVSLIRNVTWNILGFVLEQRDLNFLGVIGVKLGLLKYFIYNFEDYN